MSKPCRILNCDGLCGPKSRFDICARCRAVICVWLKRHPTAIRKRIENLARYQDRFEQTPVYKKEKNS